VQEALHNLVRVHPQEIQVVFQLFLQSLQLVVEEVAVHLQVQELMVVQVEEAKLDKVEVQGIHPL
jgi:hypothetical protein